MKAVVYIIALFLIFSWGRAYSEGSCADIQGIDAVLKRTDIRFVVVGELHGTREIPLIFSDIVCHFLAAGRRVLVGLEYLENTGSVFKEFIDSPGLRRDEGRLLFRGFSASGTVDYPDGRTSEAMLELLRRLRNFKSEGHDLSLTAFIDSEASASESQTLYEKAMASHLIEAARSGNFDTVLVFVGNVHAINARDAKANNLPFEPMATHLPAESTLSLRLNSKGGTAWNCRLNGCGIYPISGKSKSAYPKISLGNKLSPGYDGVIEIGTINASLPVEVNYF